MVLSKTRDGAVIVPENRCRGYGWGERLNLAFFSERLLVAVLQIFKISNLATFAEKFSRWVVLLEGADFCWTD